MSAKERLGMFMGEAMGRRFRSVEGMASDLGADANLIRRWLAGQELPDVSFVRRMRSSLFWPGEIDDDRWERFLDVWEEAHGFEPFGRIPQA